MYGVITHSGTKGEYWVPVDKYSIVARKEEECPLSADLAAVPQMVLSIQGFHIQSFMKRVSVSTQLAQSRGVKAAMQNGVCGKACGCKKKGVSCHCGCSCSGDCCKCSHQVNSRGSVHRPCSCAAAASRPLDMPPLALPHAAPLPLVRWRLSSHLHLMYTGWLSCRISLCYLHLA